MNPGDKVKWDACVLSFCVHITTYTQTQDHFSMAETPLGLKLCVCSSQQFTEPATQS